MQKSVTPGLFSYIDQSNKNMITTENNLDRRTII